MCLPWLYLPFLLETSLSETVRVFFPVKVFLEKRWGIGMEKVCRKQWIIHFTSHEKWIGVNHRHRYNLVLHMVSFGFTWSFFRFRISRYVFLSIHAPFQMLCQTKQTITDFLVCNYAVITQIINSFPGFLFVPPGKVHLHCSFGYRCCSPVVIDADRNRGNHQLHASNTFPCFCPSQKIPG